MKIWKVNVNIPPIRSVHHVTSEAGIEARRQRVIRALKELGIEGEVAGACVDVEEIHTESVK